jgi:hypothetical protein
MSARERSTWARTSTNRDSFGDNEHPASHNDADQPPVLVVEDVAL